MDADSELIQTTEPTMRSVPPFGRGVALFAVVSALDVALTYLLLIDGGYHEANPIARFFLDHWGVRGMVWFKIAMVTVVVAVAWAVSLKRPDVARRLMLLATLIVTGVLLYSSWLLLRAKEWI